MSEPEVRRSSGRTNCKCAQIVGRNTKLGSLRVIVILLSFISLISRIIYCSYATWLTLTTFDCVPCDGNQTSKLFVSQHSLVKLNTVRSLDTKLMANKTNVNRAKRYDHQTDQSLIDEYYETKQIAEQMTKQPFDKMTIYWTVSEDKPIERQNDWSHKPDKNDNIERSNESSLTPVIAENIDEITGEAERNVINLNVSQQTFSTTLDENDHTILENTIDIENSANLNEYNETIPITTSGKETAVLEEQSIRNSGIDESANAQTLTDITTISERNDISDASIQISSDIRNLNSVRVDKLYRLSNETRNQTNLVIEENSPNIFIGLFIKNDGSDKIPVNKTVKETQANDSGKIGANNGSFARIDKSLNHFKSIDGKSHFNSLRNLTQETIDSCSEECGQFLNIKLNDPKDRKWAMVFITCFLYLYALVMLTIFLGSCFSSVDLLIIATFIEGAKLFAGFVMLIVDNINGKKTKFSLIEVKINVDQRGNGWTADFYYSEYLLDLIIFVLAAILSVKSFRIFSKRTKKVSSIEASSNSFGTYRARHSSNTSRMLHTYRT